jgi:hypothetical protein
MQKEFSFIPGALLLGAAAAFVMCFTVAGQARAEAGLRAAAAQSSPVLLAYETRRKAHVVRRSDNSPTGVVRRTGRTAGHIARDAADTAGDVARSAARTTRSVFRELFR